MCPPSVKPSKSEDDYRAEDDLRTLTRAEEVRSDQKRMAAVQRVQRKQVRALTRVGRAIGLGGKSPRRTPRTPRTSRR